MTSTLPFLAVLISMLLSRKITSDANLKLDESKKAAIVDLFSKESNARMLIPIGILGLFLIVQYFKLLDSNISFILCMISLIAFMIFSNLSAYNKLKQNDFPNDYIKSYTLASALKIFGVLIMFLVLIIFS